MPRKIVADDYGMSIEINHAISELVKKNILSKVSVMANESLEYSMADIGDSAEIGLHINLTLDTGIAKAVHDKKRAFLKLLYLIYAKRLTIDQIIDNIKFQFKLLESRGFKIFYLDTHQHMHVIPKLLKALIIFAKANGIKSIRCITLERRYLFFYFYSLMRFGFFIQAPKMLVLYAIGILMKLKLDKAKINYCKNLILMPLAGRGDYSELLGSFFNRFKDVDAEIVVHPGLQTETITGDGYGGRYIEYLSLIGLKNKYRHEKI